MSRMLTSPTKEVVFIQGYEEFRYECSATCMSCGRWVSFPDGNTISYRGARIPILCPECWSSVLETGHVPWHPTRLVKIAAMQR